MKITKRQLKRIIKEEKQKLLNEALPPHLQKHFRKDGSSVHQPEIKDVTPDGYGPDEYNAYDDGYDDWVNGIPKPLKPDDQEYMRGWEDGMLDSEAKYMDPGDYE